MSEGECLEWSRYIDPNGYGRANLGYVHRAAYEIAFGEIPKGKQIDHLCRNRRCFNPQHLEAVSQKTNILRGESFAAKNARKNECIRGHPFNEENTYSQPSRPTERRCRECQRLQRVHRKAVAALENTLRGVTSPGGNAGKTHCKHGHEFTEENTIRRPITEGRPNGGRHCRECKRRMNRARDARKRKAVTRSGEDGE